jgi:mannosyl-oligosaccharide alpha-1,2-mannosidase
MARRSSSSSSSGAWRYLNPAYYLKRPKRLALLFFVFVAATFAFWDRQSLVSEYEVRSLSPAAGNYPLIQVGTSGI